MKTACARERARIRERERRKPAVPDACAEVDVAAERAASLARQRAEADAERSASMATRVDMSEFTPRHVPYRAGDTRQLLALSLPSVPRSRRRR